MNNVQIVGTGSYTPANIVTNEDLSKIIDTSDEWISTRTGIKERRISEGEDTSDMAAKAAKEAMKSAGIKPEEIDLIILATITPDSFMPSTACIVQKKINAVNATCFDISAACSGFIYGIDTASQFIRTGRFKTVLVIGAETLSKIVNWEDRSTCVLFGDGSGAVVLRASNEESIISVHTKSDGRKGHLLTSNAIPVSNPYVSNPLGELKVDKDVRMEGREIFKFAVNVIIETIEQLLEKASLSLEDIKYIIPHQANSRIIDFTAKKLGVKEEKFFVNLSKYGNTSAASVALAFDDFVKSTDLKSGDKIILVGFGGGLTYGGILIEWK